MRSYIVGLDDGILLSTELPAAWYFEELTITLGGGKKIIILENLFGMHGMKYPTDPNPPTAYNAIR